MTQSNITFLQTADANYWRLLKLTSKTVREYCRRNGFLSESFFGIIRGYHPWHATFNRIPLLKRILGGGYSGWVCYLDADAYIADLDFDLAEYLGDKDGVAFIAAPGGRLGWWDVNAGVFFINLSHRVGKQIIHEWASRFSLISEDELRAASRWSQVPDDQALLHQVLQDIPDAQSSVLIDGGNPRLLNENNGLFIRQILRSVGGSIEERENYIRLQTEEILQGTPEASSNDHRGQVGSTELADAALVSALYRVFLLREPDRDGLLANILGFQNSDRDIAKLIEDCIRCEEFRTKFPAFLQKYGLNNL